MFYYITDEGLVHIAKANCSKWNTKQAMTIDKT